MANEIKLSVNLSVDKGGARMVRTESKSVDMSGESFYHAVQNIDTSNETLEVYELSNFDAGEAGYIFAKNLDSTNYIEIGLTSSYTIKLKAGEFCLFRAAGAVFARANTSACELEYIYIED